MQLPLDPETVKGFMPAHEGERLYALALEAATLGPCLEVGSYCGKSTIYLGAACSQRGVVLYAVDHHRGSEEHQLGEEYHDPDLYDADIGAVDTFREFRRTVAAASLEAHVVPIVAPSEVAARGWNTGLGLVFVDGGHSLRAAQTDYEVWHRHVLPGGYLAIHDIFFDPAEGGQPPRIVYEQACESGLFDVCEMTGTLGVLRRKN